jgi:hypothetical protein
VFGCRAISSQYADRIGLGNPLGTDLPDVAAALSYAERKIRELRKESPYNDPTLMMIVKDEARKTSVLAVLPWLLVSAASAVPFGPFGPFLLCRDRPQPETPTQDLQRCAQR